MKKLLSFFASILLLTSFGYSQPTIIANNSLSTAIQQNYQSRKTHVNPEFCATDDFHKEKMANDPAYRSRHIEMEKQWKKLPIDKNPTNGIYQIPVVVHVMHKGEAVGSGTNISDAEVKAGIQYLNNFWRKVSGTNGDGTGVDMQIEFTLAIQDELGNCTDGIDRVDMSGVTSYVNNGVNRNNSNGLDDYTVGGGINSLKEYSIWDPTEFYNVWIVDEIDNKNCFTGGSYTAGYAYYASSHGQLYDGSVVLICSYTDESADTWAHEMGHAFNLPHTFDGDNYPTTCGDDGITDTPQHYRTSDIPGLYFDCSNTDANTCDPTFNEVMSPSHTGNGTHQDHMLNYMDYTGCSSEFTTGQRTVAQSAATGARASFLSGYALTPPLPATVAFSGAATVACLGGTIYFTDESTCTPNTYTNNGYTGITFSWTFDNGVDIPYTSTDQNPTITFTNLGTYDVTLEITNPQGTTNLTKTGYIIVSSGAVAGCSTSSSNDNNNFGCGVTNFSFNTLSNSSTTFIPTGALVDYTCTNNTTVDVGTPYNLDATYDARSDGPNFLEVWIDWDNSGTFSNPNSMGDNEQVLTDNILANATGTPSTSVTPPATATLNTLLRMRVVTNHNSSPTVCGNGFVQRSDDYGVMVQAAGTPPVAAFSAAATTVCEGASTVFTDASTNTPTGWTWTFTPSTVTYINSTTSTSQNPDVQFDADGTYQVQLTASNASGSDDEIKTAYITVDPLPDAAGTITGSSAECENATLVAFSITAVTNATGYVWSAPFGATVNGSGTSITVDFATTSGNVSVTPNNACGNGGSANKAVTLTGAPSISSQPNNSIITEGNNTSFSVTASNATGYQWQENTGSGFSNLSNGGVYSNVTTSTMNITTAIIGMDTYTYRCVVSGSCGADATSNASILTVNAASGLPTTELAPTSCGITLPTSNSTSYATIVPGASYYIFNVTNVGLGYDQTKTAWAGGWATKINNWSGIQYSTTYDVKVKVIIGPDTSDYGNVCQVTTAPLYSLPTTTLNQNYCGITLANTNDLVFANAVSGATYYIFNVSNSGLGYNQTKTAWTGGNGGQAIKLSNFTGILTNTTYDVKVKVVIGPDTSTYGTICQVTTPAVYAPAALTIASCNKTLTNFSDLVYSNTVPGATSYIFNITNTGLGFDYTKIAWAGGWVIRLDQIPGILVSTTYDIKVKVVIGADTSAYGTVCQVTTPASFKTARFSSFNEDNIESDLNRTDLDVKIYPNPNQGEFVYLELNGLSDDTKIIVTDIFGKTILNQPLGNDYETYNGTLRFDQKLNSGFYLVTIVSNDHKVTKKLVVR